MLTIITNLNKLKVNKMILRYDLIGASKHGVRQHPQMQMANLGIRYKSAEPFMLGDCWKFHDCTGIKASDLPSYIDLMGE